MPGAGAPFKPGNPGGPGRPKGSKHRLQESLLSALANDFEEHGVAVIEQVRVEDPSTYLKIIAAVLPKDVRAQHEHRLVESISEDHARLVAEGYLESLRGYQVISSPESGGVHVGVPARLPAGITTSPGGGGVAEGGIGPLQATYDFCASEAREIDVDLGAFPGVVLGEESGEVDSVRDLRSGLG